MDLKLNNEMMQSVIAKSIFDAITPENRDELIKQALKDLLTPVALGVGFNSNKISPIQAAMNRAALDFMEKYIETEFNMTEKYKDKLKEMVNQTFDQLFEGEFAQQLSKNVVDGLIKQIHRY